MSEKYSVQIPIELQDRLSHEFERISAVVKGKEQAIRESMASVKNRSTEALTSIRVAVQDLDKSKVDLRNIENLRKRLGEVAGESKSAGNETKVFYQKLLETNAAELKAAGGAKTLSKELDTVGASGARTADIFKGALGANLVAGGFMYLVRQVKEVSRSFLDANIQYEQSSVAFEVMLKSAEKAKVLLAQVSQFAAETPFQLPELNNATRALLAFGSSASEVVPELRRIGDISSGITAPIGEIAELYGKARVQGTLFAEDINQLTGRGIPIIQEFAKILGVAEGSVKEMGSQGRITFDMLEQAFINMTSSGGQFEGMMAKQSKTLGGLISTIKDGLVQVLRDIGEGGLMDRLRTIAKDTAEWFSQNAEKVKAFANELGDKLGTAIAFTLGHMGELLALGKAFFFVFSVVKIGQLVLGFNALAIAMKALVVANPILAGISVALLAGYTAYTQIKGAAEEFNSESKKLKEGEDLLFSYNKQLERTKTLTEKVAEMNKKAQENNPFAYIGAEPEKKKAPAPKVTKLTEEQKRHQDQLLQLKEEYAKASAAVALSGQEMETAIEKAEYEKRKVQFGKHKDTLELVNQIHKEKLLTIEQKYNDQIHDARLKDLDASRKVADAKAMAEADAKIKANADLMAAQDSLDRSQTPDSRYTQELERSRAHFQEIREAHKEALDLRLISETEYSNRIIQIQAKEAGARSKIQAQAALDTASSVTGNLAGALRGFKSFGTAYKAAMHAKNLVDTYASATASYSSLAGIPIVGPALGGAAAAAAIVAGLARGVMINREKFEYGGSVRGPRHSSGGVPVELEGGEFIFSRRDVENFGGAGVLEALRQNQGWGHGGASQNVFNLAYHAPAFGGGAGGSSAAVDFSRIDKIEFGRWFDQVRAKGYVS